MMTKITAASFLLLVLVGCASQAPVIEQVNTAEIEARYAEKKREPYIAKTYDLHKPESLHAQGQDLVCMNPDDYRAYKKDRDTLHDLYENNQLQIQELTTSYNIALDKSMQLETWGEYLRLQVNYLTVAIERYSLENSLQKWAERVFAGLLTVGVAVAK